MKKSLTKNTNHSEDEFSLSHSFSDQDLNLLKARGVRAIDMLGPSSRMNLRDMLTDIQVDTPGLKPTLISKNTQIKKLRRLWENPFSAFSTVAVSSIPSDLAAKRLAICIFHRAITLQTSDTNPIKKINKSLPVWHTVYGGFKDQMLESGSTSSPTFLVISNVTIDSTAPKIEKVRDLIEKYHAIPKIVVVAGSEPTKFFRERIFSPVEAVFYLSGTERQLSTDLLDL